MPQRLGEPGATTLELAETPLLLVGIIQKVVRPVQQKMAGRHQRPGRPCVSGGSGDTSIFEADALNPLYAEGCDAADTVAIEKPVLVRLAQDTPTAEPDATVMFTRALRAGAYGSSVKTSQPKDPHTGPARGSLAETFSGRPRGLLGSDIQRIRRGRRPTRYPSVPSTKEPSYGDRIPDERATRPSAPALS